MRQEETWYRAMLSRDPRFDGKFYVGVKTTGVYCRPICPARPKRENVEFFPSALLAERKGYRPCLRCRPETAPQSPAWHGHSALVQRALKAISEGGHAPWNESDFAARFGVTARHLRRLFAAEVGKSPKRIFLENRLGFARTLIVETSLPLSEIAHAAGFASSRRFHAAIRERFRRAPSLLRKRNAAAARNPAAAREEGIRLSLPFRPPLDWESALAYYRSHAIAGLERFEAGLYERIFRFGTSPGIVQVTLAGSAGSLELRVFGGGTASLGRVARSVRRMFDLDSDPLLVANAFAADRRLARLHRLRPGIRCPRGWDPFETAVCAILGQLVSIAQANRMIARMVAAYGEPFPHPLTGAESRGFPSPKVLAASDLERVGTTRARRETLREFSRRIAAGELSLDSTQDPAAFREAMLAIKGIGPWTAEYVSLRCIADADAFPATDLVLGRAPLRYPGIDIESVRPWRGYAAAYLWQAHAAASSRPRSSR